MKTGWRIRATCTVMAAVCLCCSGTGWSRKKSTQTIATPDGSPVRKVYIQSAVPGATEQVAAQLSRDTCLIVVQSAKQADAVVNIGVALPSIEGNSSTPNFIGASPSATPQTLGNAKSGPERSTSVNCSDKKDGGCNTTSKMDGGSLTGQTTLGASEDSRAAYDVSLASVGGATSELWEPDTSRKQPWADQLRVAAGCPVCPGEHFDRRKYKSYREWMMEKCPTMMTAVQ